MKLYVVTIALIFGIALAGIAVDRFYGRFARRNPELGPFRRNDGGCGCCAAKEACNSDAGVCRG
jgi:hypothetical protein